MFDIYDMRLSELVIKRKSFVEILPVVIERIEPLSILTVCFLSSFVSNFYGAVIGRSSGEFVFVKKNGLWEENIYKWNIEPRIGQVLCQEIHVIAPDVVRDH